MSDKLYKQYTPNILDSDHFDKMIYLGKCKDNKHDLYGCKDPDVVLSYNGAVAMECAANKIGPDPSPLRDAVILLTKEEIFQQPIIQIDIRGCAGTGKSTILKTIHSHLKSLGIDANITGSFEAQDNYSDHVTHQRRLLSLRQKNINVILNEQPAKVDRRG